MRLPPGGFQRPHPPAGKRWVSPLQSAPQNCGPQGPRPDDPPLTMTRDIIQAVKRRPGRILERHDLAEDSTRQANLETSQRGTLRLPNDIADADDGHPTHIWHLSYLRSSILHFDVTEMRNANEVTSSSEEGNLPLWKGSYFLPEHNRSILIPSKSHSVNKEASLPASFLSKPKQGFTSKCK